MNGNLEKSLVREEFFTLSADLILFNGNVITINPKQPRVKAVAIKRGKIIGVGSTSGRMPTESITMA
ncbi:unnamed protein product [marine sediment metagenome]|uniref:Uncharacterized protein n=1 Tax=marine sediment metagenome TaxID=412755 RepID=X1U3C2_9ZZZZ